MTIGLSPKPPFEEKITQEKNTDKKILYPFQKLGVKWFIEKNGTGLLADDMGLGKSCQAITYLKINPELRPALIVCPASIKINWQREIELWSGEKSFLITGRRSTVLPSFPFYIINYDILAEEMKIKKPLKNGKIKIQKVLKDSSWIFKLASMGIKAIVADECSALSNPTAIRTKGFIALRKLNNKVKFMPLSGTPIKNKPAEFFTILNLLAEKEFPNRWKYLHHYCDPKHNGFGWTFNGATNIKELHDRLQFFMLRRTKDEVLKDLPPKRKIIVPMEVDEVAIKNYNTASAEFIEWVQNHQTAGLALQENVDRLKQLAYIAKRNSVISWLEQYLESDNKLVVGLYHKHAMEDLLNHFKKIAVHIDGSVTGQKRQDAVDAFQKNNKIKLILCQLLTVPGLTLTAAPATCTIEFSWAPADHLQFEDRVHRIGQEADSVTAYYLIAPNTIDEESMAMVNNKFTVLTQVMDGKENADIFEDSFLKQILKKYGKKRL